MPISEWLGNQLKDWSEELLSKKNCEMHNLFNYEKIKELKSDHFNYKNNHEHKLWSIIQFNSWYTKNYAK